MALSSVLMIEPKNFISNPQTVGDNFFQQLRQILRLINK
jgi:hypothetical protein